MTITVIVNSNSPSGGTTLFYDDFDSNNLSGYQQLGGTWTTASQSGRGFVLRHTSNSRTIIFPQGENFTGSYEVRAEMWNEDNDDAGLAFRVWPSGSTRRMGITFTVVRPRLIITLMPGCGVT
jgi:hypothetical protein